MEGLRVGFCRKGKVLIKTLDGGKVETCIVSSANKFLEGSYTLFSQWRDWKRALEQERDFDLKIASLCQQSQPAQAG